MYNLQNKQYVDTFIKRQIEGSLRLREPTDANQKELREKLHNNLAIYQASGSTPLDINIISCVYAIREASAAGLIEEVSQSPNFDNLKTEDSRSISIEDPQSRVFISYASEDYNAALRLYNDLLSKTDLKPWLDKMDLLPGQNWDIEIRNAIKNSRYFIALFSSISVTKRGYIQRELKRALEIFEEFPEGQIFAIPARLDNCKTPYEKFGGIERVDLFPDWDKGLQRLLRSFQKH